MLLQLDSRRRKNPLCRKERGKILNVLQVCTMLFFCCRSDNIVCTYVCLYVCVCVCVNMQTCVCVCMCMCLNVLESLSHHCACHRNKNVRTNPIELPSASSLAYSPCVYEAKDLSISSKVLASFIRYEKGLRNVCAVYFYYFCNIGLW